MKRLITNFITALGIAALVAVPLASPAGAAPPPPTPVPAQDEPGRLLVRVGEAQTYGPIGLVAKIAADACGIPMKEAVATAREVELADRFDGALICNTEHGADVYLIEKGN